MGKDRWDIIEAILELIQIDNLEDRVRFSHQVFATIAEVMNAAERGELKPLLTKIKRKKND